MSTTVGVIRETAPAEHRVALTPDAVADVTELGLDVLVETGAGAHAWWPDIDYAAAGARIVSNMTLFRRADVILTVDGADDGTVRRMRAGRTLIGLLAPLRHPSLVRTWLACGITTVSLDLAEVGAIDAVTGQAEIAGYKAAVLAADTFGGFFPDVTGTAAAVLVLGSGAAAGAAAGTARRLGATVIAHEVGSLDAIIDRISDFDVVITATPVAGHKPPVLIDVPMLHRMRPGSVVVDMAAGPFGGSVEGAEMGVTTVIDPGVIVIGAADLPSRMAPAASARYARAMVALLRRITRRGVVTIDPTDDVQAALLVTHGGRIVNAEIARASSLPHSSHPGAA